MKHRRHQHAPNRRNGEALAGRRVRPLARSLVLYAVLGSLGVTGSLNQLFAELTGGSASGSPLFTTGRIVGGAAVLAAVNVVLLTLLATLGALLYNLASSLVGGLQVTLSDD